MVRNAALFVVWAAIGFALSFELLYLLTPFGIAGLALVAAVAWVLEGRGLNRQPRSGASSPVPPCSASWSPPAWTNPPPGH